MVRAAGTRSTAAWATTCSSACTAITISSAAMARTPFSTADATITTGITADLADPSHNTGLAAGDTYDGVENVLGSILDDTLIGDDGNNVLMGSFGNDRLIGGAGADVLNGGYFYSGDITDWYEGTINGAGDGFDIASYETASSGVIASLSNPANNTGDAAGD